MSSLLSGPSSISPWIESAAFNGITKGIDIVQRRPKLVQVLSRGGNWATATATCERERNPPYLLLHDGQTFAAAFLSKAAQTSLGMKANASTNASTIVTTTLQHQRAKRGSILRINDWTLSTVRQQTRTYPNDLSTPICLLLQGNVEVIGGDDMGIVGNPNDVNATIQVKRALATLSPSTTNSTHVHSYRSKNSTSNIDSTNNNNLHAILRRRFDQDKDTDKDKDKDKDMDMDKDKDKDMELDTNKKVDIDPTAPLGNARDLLAKPDDLRAVFALVQQQRMCEEKSESAATNTAAETTAVAAIASAPLGNARDLLAKPDDLRAVFALVQQQRLCEEKSESAATNTAAETTAVATIASAPLGNASDLLAKPDDLHAVFALVQQQQQHQQQEQQQQEQQQQHQQHQQHQQKQQQEQQEQHQQQEQQQHQLDQNLSVPVVNVHANAKTTICQVVERIQPTTTAPLPYLSRPNIHQTVAKPNANSEKDCAQSDGDSSKSDETESDDEVLGISNMLVATQDDMDTVIDTVVASEFSNKIASTSKISNDVHAPISLKVNTSASGGTSGGTSTAISTPELGAEVEAANDVVQKGCCSNLSGNHHPPIMEGKLQSVAISKTCSSSRGEEPLPRQHGNYTTTTQSSYRMAAVVPAPPPITLPTLKPKCQTAFSFFDKLLQHARDQSKDGTSVALHTRKSPACSVVRNQNQTSHKRKMADISGWLSQNARRSPGKASRSRPRNCLNII